MTAHDLDRRLERVAGDTALQEALQALFDVLLDSRDDLSDEAYTVFVDIAATAIGFEATRLLIGEALRATRQASAEAA